MAGVFKPKSVRELLTEMKDVSDLTIDLAYAALLFRSKELAGHLHNLEERMDGLMDNIRTIAAVVTRDVHEARKITGILQVASAGEAISNATGDMADLIRARMKIHPVVQDALKIADEKISLIKIHRSPELENKKLSDLKLASRIGVIILAIKLGKKWIIRPSKDTELQAGDSIVVKGPPDGITILRKMANAGREDWTPKHGLPTIRKGLAEMRDLSSLIVDMAYSSILFGSYEIAEDVKEINEKFKKLGQKLRLDVLKAARKERDTVRLSSVLNISRSMEQISDAGYSIADILLSKLELHPVFAEALEEADEQIGRADVKENSEFVGKSLRELNLWVVMGVYVLMIKRGQRYIFDPPRRTKIQAGDSLIVRGFRRGVQNVKKVAGGKR